MKKYGNNLIMNILIIDSKQQYSTRKAFIHCAQHLQLRYRNARVHGKVIGCWAASAGNRRPMSL